MRFIRFWEFEKAYGRDIMRIAVTYDNGEVFQHFGHCGQFKVYDVENGIIVSQNILEADGVGHGALALLLSDSCIDALICGGIGMGAQMALNDAGIKFYAGVQGSADEAVRALVNGVLNYDPYARCDHHEHQEGDCGHGGCGEHNCAGN